MLLWTDKECGRWVQIAMVSGDVSFCQLGAFPYLRTCFVRNLTEPGGELPAGVVPVHVFV